MATISNPELGITIEFGARTSELDAAAQKAAKDVEQFGKKADDAATKARGGWASLGPVFSGVGRAATDDLAGQGASSLGAFGRVSDQVLHGMRGGWEAMPPVFKGVALALGAATLAIGAALAGKKFSDATAEMIESTRDLARALGTTTNEASVLRAALDDVGASDGEFEGAAKGLSRQLRQNESDLIKLGLATRDVNGHLRPLKDLTLDALEVMKGYREGTDRALVGQQLFGRGIDASSRLMLLNKETIEANRKAVQELGLVVGESATAAWGEYDNASDRASLTMKAFGKAIGESVMPVITTLTEWFNNIAPAAIIVVRGALSGLSTAFLALANGVAIVWEVIKAFLFSVTDPLVALGSALVKLLQGDFKGAQQEMMDWPGRIAGVWSKAWDNMVTSSQQAHDRIGQIWGFATGGNDAKGDSGAAPGDKKAPTKPPPGTKEKLPETYMAYYEGMLAEERKAQAAMTDGRQLSKAEELAFWEFLLQTARLTEKDKVAILRKTADLQTAIWKEQAAKRQQMAENDVEHGARMADMQLAADRAAAQVEVQLGHMTKDQLFVAEQDFEARRYAIKAAGLEQRLGLLDPDMDPVLYRQIKQQIEEAEAEHQAKLAEIRGQFAVQSAEQQAAVWQDLGQRMSSLWDQGVQAMMNGTFRWRNAMHAIGTQLIGWFANSVVKPMVARWIFGESAKTGATAAGTATRMAMEVWAAAKSVALWAATAVKNIMSSAWEAMAGVYASVAKIPYIGWILAPAMAAVAFVGVAKMASNVMSAEGGYDIPAGVNPLVQTHAKEMILPARYADVIRGMGDGDGGEQGGGELKVEMKHAGRAGDHYLITRDNLADAVRQAYRAGRLQFGK